MNCNRFVRSAWGSRHSAKISSALCKRYKTQNEIENAMQFIRVLKNMLSLLVNFSFFEIN